MRLSRLSVIGSWRIERCDDNLEKPGQAGSLVGVEATEQCVLSDHQILERVVDSLAAVGGELDPHRPSIARVGSAADKPSLFEMVQSVGHGSRSDQGLGEELPGGQVVGRTGSTEGGEHVEGPGFEVMPGKHRGSLTLEVVGQPADAGQDFERRHIDAWKRPSPSGYQVLDLVFHRVSSVLGAIYLDIKRYERILSSYQETGGPKDATS